MTVEWTGLHRLFSAAITYGKNVGPTEETTCRWSGQGLHRLFERRDHLLPLRHPLHIPGDRLELLPPVLAGVCLVVGGGVSLQPQQGLSIGVAAVSHGSPGPGRSSPPGRAGSVPPAALCSAAAAPHGKAPSQRKKAAESQSKGSVLRRIARKGTVLKK